jgi:hypothetical protein
MSPHCWPDLHTGQVVSDHPHLFLKKDKREIYDINKNIAFLSVFCQFSAFFSGPNKKHPKTL